MVFIDANTYVYANTACPEHEESAAAIIGPAQTDALVLLEVHRAMSKITRDVSKANRIVQRIIAQHTIIDVTQDSVFEALKHSELDLADAIHYVLADGDEIITWDRKLKAYAKKR